MTVEKETEEEKSKCEANAAKLEEIKFEKGKVFSNAKEDMLFHMHFKCPDANCNIRSNSRGHLRTHYLTQHMGWLTRR